MSALADGRGDPDGDGVAGAADRCPQRAGLPPDGCPPVDTDGDRVPDAADKCVDYAGPPANQGCPDKDSDGDLTVDRLDQCPVVMGPADLAGCPPPDADDDGVPDDRDRCADSREVWNNTRDTDGCPDRGAAVVEVGEGRVRLVRFPRLDKSGRAVAKSEGWRMAIAARALASVRAQVVTVAVSADYGLSYGDSVNRARAVSAAVADALVKATGLPETSVRAVTLGPDGHPRVEIRYR